MRKFPTHAAAIAVMVAISGLLAAYREHGRTVKAERIQRAAQFFHVCAPLRRLMFVQMTGVIPPRTQVEFHMAEAK